MRKLLFTRFMVEKPLLFSFFTCVAFCCLLTTCKGASSSQSSVASNTDIAVCTDEYSSQFAVKPDNGFDTGKEYLTKELYGCIEIIDTAFIAESESECTEPPMYPGGTNALIDYLATHLKYPKDAVADSIQGRILIKFLVERDGCVSNPTIVGGGLYVPNDTAKYRQFYAEAIRLVREMPTWIPGKDKNGETCSTWFTIPIYFRLE